MAREKEKTAEPAKTGTPKSAVDALVSRRGDKPSIFDLLVPQIQAALPKHLDAARFMRLTLTALRAKPDLAKDQPSLLASIMLAAQVGLELDPVLGYAYLVPYKGKVTLQIGYKGYLLLARQSSLVADMHADYVVEGDEFDYSYGSRKFLHHKPAKNRLVPLKPGDDGVWQLERPLVGAYMFTTLRGGGEEFIFLDESEILARRNASAAWRSGYDTPWKSHPWAMYRKTAVRAWAPQGPMQVQRLAGVEDFQDRGYVPRVDVAQLALPPAPEGLEIDLVPAEMELEPAVPTPTSKLDAFVAKLSTYLGPAQAEALRAYAREKGVAIERVEELWGCPLQEVTVGEGMDAETEVRDTIDDLAEKAGKA